jgi:hypothetical protein
MKTKRTITIALVATALAAGLGVAGCGTTTVTQPASSSASIPAGQPGAEPATGYPGMNGTPTPTMTMATGPLGTTFTSTYYGANDAANVVFKVRLEQVVDPAKLDPSALPLATGASHAAALEFYIQDVTGAASGPVDGTAQVTGTDGEVFSAMTSGAIDTNVYVSSSATSLYPGEHGDWWVEADLPAGVQVKSVRYEDVDIYTPPGTMPVTWVVSAS